MGIETDGSPSSSTHTPPRSGSSTPMPRRRSGVSPGMIVTDDFAGALESRADMAAGLASSYPLYRMLGLESALPEIRAVSALTDRITTVRVRWSYLDADDEVIVTTDYEYLLRDDADGLRVYLAVGIDEAEALERAARTRGVDLDLFG